MTDTWRTRSLKSIQVLPIYCEKKKLQVSNAIFRRLHLSEGDFETLMEVDYPYPGTPPRSIPGSDFANHNSEYDEKNDKSCPNAPLRATKLCFSRKKKNVKSSIVRVRVLKFHV